MRLAKIGEGKAARKAKRQNKKYDRQDNRATRKTIKTNVKIRQKTGDPELKVAETKKSARGKLLPKKK